MIVEDNKLSLETEQQLLIRLGYDVIDSEEAENNSLYTIRNSEPDVVLINLNLLSASKGIAFVEQMRLEGNYTPVVFLSKEVSNYKLLAYKNLGCIDYLVTPFSADKLDRYLKMATEYSSLSAGYAA